MPIADLANHMDDDEGELACVSICEQAGPSYSLKALAVVEVFRLKCRTLAGYVAFLDGGQSFGLIAGR